MRRRAPRPQGAPPRPTGAWPALVVFALALIVSCAPAPPPVPGPTPAPPRHAAGTETAPAPIPATFDLGAEPMIEVGLAVDLDTLELTAPAQAQLELRTGDAGRSRGRIRIRISGAEARWENLRAGASSGEDERLAAGDTLWVGNADSPADTLVRWNGRTWRGRFKIFVNPRGKLTLVDRLPLESYLLGVVPGEIGSLDGSLLEAGRAQAIAARSYTLFYRGRRAAEGFDLLGSVEDQVYGPFQSERPLATRCVESTRGVLALSQGFPIRANYCSTCGGMTADVWEAWPADPLPYLVSHSDRASARTGVEKHSADYCAASPQYRWREEWTAAEFMANLTHYAPLQGVIVPAGGPGDLLDVRVDGRSRSGRAWRLVVASTSGDVVIPAYSVRQVLRRGGNGGAILKSNLFKIDVRRDPATRRALAVVASGAGFGHGVGLCQTGALGMAREGRDAREILEHYYRGAEVRRLY